MATYTSTQAGDWNADATWGGSGHPTSNADLAIIGHAVKYNIGESTVTWGNITINSGGILYFPVDASSKLIMAAEAVLTVNSGGELRTGTSSAVAAVDDAYTLKIHFRYPSASKNVLVVNSGGKINLWGDPAFYGSSRYAPLDSNWTSGTSLYVTGDYSAKWKAGQVFYIHDNADSYTTNGYQVQGKTYRIGAVGAYDSGNDRTEITVDLEYANNGTTSTPSNPWRSCYAVSAAGYHSQLIMVSRNVEVSDPLASLGVYHYITYTERLQMDNNNAYSDTAGNVYFKDCLFCGWSAGLTGGGYYTKVENAVVFNSVNGIQSENGSIIDADIISCQTSAYSSLGCSFTGKICSCSYGLSTCNGCVATGDIISCLTVFYGTPQICTVIGDIVCSANAFGGFSSELFGNIYASTTAIGSNTTNAIWKGNAYGNGTDATNCIKTLWIGDSDSTPVISANSAYPFSKRTSLVREDSTVGGSARLPQRIYTNAGTILPLVSGDTGFQTPDSGNTWIFQATPISTCGTEPIVNCNEIPLSPINPIAAYVTSGSKTLTYKIWPVGWTTSCDQDDVVLDVSYLNSASGITRTTVYNTSQTYDNGAWRSCSVTFNPAQDGIVYINMYIRRYEVGDYILIDPVFTVA